MIVKDTLKKSELHTFCVIILEDLEFIIQSFIDSLVSGPYISNIYISLYVAFYVILMSQTHIQVLPMCYKPWVNARLTGWERIGYL